MVVKIESSESKATDNGYKFSWVDFHLEHKLVLVANSLSFDSFFSYAAWLTVNLDIKMAFDKSGKCLRILSYRLHLLVFPLTYLGVDFTSGVNGFKSTLTGIFEVEWTRKYLKLKMFVN